MRYIVQAVPRRRKFVEGLKSQIPSLEVHYDRWRCPLEAFHECFRIMGGDAHVHLEDDVILCRRFTENVEAAIARHPETLIVFHERADVFGNPPKTVSLPGSAACIPACMYFPAGLGPRYLDWFEHMVRHGYEPNWNTNDEVLSRWMIATNRRYLCWFPNLVQHRIGRSEYMPGAKRDRQTLFFNPDGWIE